MEKSHIHCPDLTNWPNVQSYMRQYCRTWYWHTHLASVVAWITPGTMQHGTTQPIQGSHFKVKWATSWRQDLNSVGWAKWHNTMLINRWIQTYDWSLRFEHSYNHTYTPFRAVHGRDTRGLMNIWSIASIYFKLLLSSNQGLHRHLWEKPTTHTLGIKGLSLFCSLL